MTMKQALATQLALVGIVLVEMALENGVLRALVDESLAEEPLCPLAFDRVVGALSWELLGARLTGRFTVLEPTAQPVPAPAPAATTPAPLQPTAA